MKIYGKEHDYYDCALVYGQDPLCVWHRKFENIQVKYDYRSKEISDFPISFGWGKDIDDKLEITDLTNVCFSTGFVLFCGKTYPFIRTIYQVLNSSNLPEIKHHYDVQSIEKYLRSIEPKKAQDFLYKPRRQYYFRGTDKKNNIGQMEKFFARMLNQTKQEELHKTDNIPAYVYHNGQVYISGPLEKFEFQKVMDPFSCLQEINMYISGVLGGQSPKMVEISDIDKIGGKGFDKVTSFRNMKRD